MHHNFFFALTHWKRWQNPTQKEKALSNTVMFVVLLIWFKTEFWYCFTWWWLWQVWLIKQYLNNLCLVFLQILIHSCYESNIDFLTSNQQCCPTLDSPVLVWHWVYLGDPWLTPDWHLPVELKEQRNPCHGQHKHNIWALGHYKYYFYRYKNYHIKKETVFRPSYLYNGNFYTWKNSVYIWRLLEGF